MRLWLILIAVFALTPVAVQAQDSPQSPEEAAAHPDIAKDPICFKVRNEASYKVFGNFVTNYYKDPATGTVSRHRSNFMLKEAGGVDDKGEPADRAEFCSYGPFYPDHKLELVLRSLFPIFNCMTKLDQGEIVIKGERKADDSGVKTWAECFE